MNTYLNNLHPSLSLSLDKKMKQRKKLHYQVNCAYSGISETHREKSERTECLLEIKNFFI